MDQYIFTMQCHLLNQIKVWHWQTLQHASHVALGELYNTLADKIDLLAEAWQGRISQRIQVDGLSLAEFVNWDEVEVAINLITQSIESTSEQVAELEKLGSFGDIINILEEINGTMARSLYLLTLK